MRIHHSIINVRFINIDKSYILVSFVLKASPYHSVCHSGIHRTEPSVGQTLESFHWRNPLRVLTIVDHVASFPSKKNTANILRDSIVVVIRFFRYLNHSNNNNNNVHICNCLNGI